MSEFVPFSKNIAGDSYVENFDNNGGYMRANRHRGQSALQPEKITGEKGLPDFSLYKKIEY